MGVATTGADLLVRCLQAGGIDTVFALPGEETSDLMDVLSRSEIEIVLCRHEQAAAFMASVHGRLTGRPAACLSTLGPGATNLMTGVADATLDLVPLVAITGQGARSRLPLGKNSHQILNLERVFEPLTKVSSTVPTTDAIPGIVANALEEATQERPGAVHISLPEDLAAAEADGDLTPVSFPERHTPYPNPNALAAAVNRMQQADRPIVLAGAGVIRAKAEERFAEFASKTGIPVATSFMGKGLLADEFPQHIGAFGLPTEDHVDRAIAEADLIIAVGLDPVEYSVAKLSDSGRIPSLHIGETPIAKDLGWHLEAEVVGDIAASLDAIGQTKPTNNWSVWPTAADARARRLSDANHAMGVLDQPVPRAEALTAVLNANLKENDVLLSGVGTHKLALARGLMPKRPGQVVIANGLAGMGLALPGAIAAARLQQFDRVLAVCGDGDVMMNIQDMETATRLDLALTVVVWVDGGFGLIEDKQEAETGGRPELGFAKMDWAQLAGAFGWHHTDCISARDLGDALEMRTEATRRHLVTVPVQYDGSLA